MCGEGIYPRWSAWRSWFLGAAAQPRGDKSPRHTKVMRVTDECDFSIPARRATFALLGTRP